LAFPLCKRHRGIPNWFFPPEAKVELFSSGFSHDIGGFTSLAFPLCKRHRGIPTWFFPPEAKVELFSSGFSHDRQCLPEVIFPHDSIEGGIPKFGIPNWFFLRFSKEIVGPVSVDVFQFQ
jgi:hypothetical protein